MTNTIQINRSFSATGPGTTLLDGELAYSYVSNSLFIGGASGAGNAAWTLFGGNTGDINWVGITAGAGLTGTIITGSGIHAQTLSIDSGSTLYVAGMSCDGGATFGGDVNFLGNAIVATGGYLQWPDGTTQSTRENITFELDSYPLDPTDEPHRTLNIRTADTTEIN
ncbi:MAG: hypothetical protein H8D80_01280, partial [Proteobacteria bacterium]|nr:hypothetical protein [Pseudomonadota bacterium]